MTNLKDIVLKFIWIQMRNRFLSTNNKDMQRNQHRHRLRKFSVHFMQAPSALTFFAFFPVAVVVVVVLHLLIAFVCSDSFLDIHSVYIWLLFAFECYRFLSTSHTIVARVRSHLLPYCCFSLSSCIFHSVLCIVVDSFPYNNTA